MLVSVCIYVNTANQTMTQDIVAVWQHLFGSSQERVPTLLVGHSMGGALAVWAAATKQIAGLEGVVVIDVVEGTALGEVTACCGCLGLMYVESVSMSCCVCCSNLCASGLCFAQKRFSNLPPCSCAVLELAPLG